MSINELDILLDENRIELDERLYLLNFIKKFVLFLFLAGFGIFSLAAVLSVAFIGIIAYTS